MTLEIRSTVASPRSVKHPDRRLWLSLGLLAASALTFEINLIRLFSVAQFYHLAFMVVSIALLGFGASGTVLSIFPTLPNDAPNERLAKLAALASASIVGAYLLTNGLPFDSFSIAWDRKQIPILAIHYLALAAPFFFCGLALSSLLGQFSANAGAVYAANLFGSGAGSLVALLVPQYVGAEGTVTVAAGTAAIAALASLELRGATRRPAGIAAIGLALICVLDLSLRILGVPILGPVALRLSPYKALSYALQAPGAQVTYRRWNAFSRIDVISSSAMHTVPGLSYRYLEPLPTMPGLFWDGDDLSPVVNASQDAAFAAYLPTAIALELRPNGDVLILEPRGGLDVLAALSLNSGSKTVVESNPLITGIVPIYKDRRLQTHVESGRSFLHRTSLTYDIIVLSLTSSYHPVRSGAYALAEDYRYTIEAFDEAVRHLSPHGIMISTRWLQDPPSEDLRLLALASAAVRRAGGEPRTQLVAFRGFNMASVMLRNGDFTQRELADVRRLLSARAFDLSYAPDVLPQETNRYNVLQDSKYHMVYSALMSAASDVDFYEAYAYDVSPPTDDRPFFGHYFKWAQAPQVLAEFGMAWQPFGGAGYLVVVALLLLAILLAGALILLPLALRRRRQSKHFHVLDVRDLLFFGLLGLGFMLVEIPLMQSFILYLGQPSYAAGIVLFSLLVFSGLGSRLSASVPLRIALGLLATAVLALPGLLRLMLDMTLGLSLAVRVCLAALMIAPLGMLMGMPFPGRIRLMHLHQEAGASNPVQSRVAWAWAVNGAVSVVASILAALLAITFGFAWVLRIGALCYAGAFMVEASAGFRSPDRSAAQT